MDGSRVESVRKTYSKSMRSRSEDGCRLDRANPNLKRSLQRPLYQLQNEQQSSAFFSQATLDVTTDIAPHAGKKQEMKSDDRASTPSSFQSNIPGSKREKNKALSETKKPVKSSTNQVIGGEHKTLFRFESSQRIQRPSQNLDYEERWLHTSAPLFHLRSVCFAKHLHTTTARAPRWIGI